MKIHILSDLHTEHSSFSLPVTESDIIVLAGDIGVGLGGLDWLHQQLIEKPVLYIPGNHDFYHHDTSLIDDMKQHANNNIHILNNDIHEISGVRFLGATLWADFEHFGTSTKINAMEYAQHNLADFSVISHQGKPFSPTDAIALHEESYQWLRDKLSDGYQGKTVVITHHAPSALSVHPNYQEDLITATFVSSLDELMSADNASLWIHGHMHKAFDYEITGTRVICNPRGHPPYKTHNGFVSDLVIEV